MAESFFRIHGTDYPYVSPLEWRIPDFKLARELTDLAPIDLLSGRSDVLLMSVAFAAVAFQHTRPEATHQNILDFFATLKPDDIEEHNFALEAEAPKDGGDADVPPPSSPSETSEPSTAPTQAT